MQEQRPRCPSSACLLDPCSQPGPCSWHSVLPSGPLALWAQRGLGVPRQDTPLETTSESRHFSRLRSWTPVSRASEAPAPRSFSALAYLIPGVPRYQLSQTEIQVGGLRATRRPARPCALRPSVGLWQDQLCAGAWGLSDLGGGGLPKVGSPGAARMNDHTVGLNTKSVL